MNVLIVERPSAFRDALVSALKARGADVHASDGALEALGKLRELSPGLVVVSEGAGPPGVASTARMVRRQLGEVPVYHLHDPSLGASAPDTRSLSRLDDVTELARVLVVDDTSASAASAETVRPPSQRPQLDDLPLDELVEVTTEPPPAASPPPIAPPVPPPPAILVPPPAAGPSASAPPIAQPPAVVAPTATVTAPAAVVARITPDPLTAAAPAPDDSDRALLAEVEPLVHQGRWLELIELVTKREPDALRLSPRLQLLYAVALKEAPSTGASPRPNVDPDLLGVRAIAALLRLPGQSTTALMIAKRVLRRRPLEWQREPPRRVSIVLTLVALALGAAAGLAFSQHLIRLLFG